MHAAVQRMHASPVGSELDSFAARLTRLGTRKLPVGIGVDTVRARPVAATTTSPFRSHLPMRGVPVRAIQELAEHQDLAPTQRYMRRATFAWVGGGGSRTLKGTFP